MNKVDAFIHQSGNAIYKNYLNRLPQLPNGDPGRKEVRKALTRVASVIREAKESNPGAIVNLANYQEKLKGTGSMAFLKGLPEDTKDQMMRLQLNLGNAAEIKK